MYLPEHILTVQAQTWLFLGSVLLGLPLGLLLDCFRIARALIPHRAFAVFLEDALYVFVCAFCLQIYASVFAHSVLRMYCFLGALLGLLLYLCTVGTVIMRICGTLRSLLRAFFCRIRQKASGFFVKCPKFEQENTEI